MLNLNRESIERANAVSHFDAGDQLAKEAESVYTRGISAMSPADPDVLNEKQHSILESRCNEFKTLVEKAYNDIISRRASWIPVTVAGPSNYNCNRNNARADAQLNASAEWREKIDRFISNTAGMIRDALPMDQIIAEYRSGKRRDPISTDDPNAIEKLTARLEYMEECHETDKKMNAYWRKHGSLKGFPGIDDARAARLDEEINNAPSFARAPAPSFTLTNRNAEMKRIRDRINSINKQRTAGDSETVYHGFTVEKNGTEGRMNIAFNEKPRKEVCDLLNDNGFNWSPRFKIWTRKLTDNASYDLRAFVLPALLKFDEYNAPAAVSADVPADVSADVPAIPAPAESLHEAAPAADPSPVERDPKQPRGPVPEKTFIGTTIEGNHFKIVFDGDAQRTRVIIPDDFKAAARSTIEAAGFYYSPRMDSWNKKLTFKAYRAALALAEKLNFIA